LPTTAPTTAPTAKVQPVAWPAGPGTARASPQPGT